ncbi:MAG: hypothetical protein NVS3B5_24100 [Sphingomicrobium sp.]
MVNEAELALVVDTALARVFEKFGVDVADRAELRQLGRDLIFLRGMREAAEEREEAIRRTSAEVKAKRWYVAAERALNFCLGVLLAYVLFHFGWKVP